MTCDKRIWEIDLTRGLAIILMIAFHIVVDLKDFYSVEVDYLSGFWYYEGKLAAILFILTAGISSTFSRNNLKRGLIIFGWGMVLTLATYVYKPEFYIVFGILHFLGLSMLLYYFIRMLESKYIFIFGTVVTILGSIFLKVNVEESYLFPIGLTNEAFGSMDYYPLFPWLGIFMFGVLIGRALYSGKKSLFPLAPKPGLINYMGRYSLLIYLIHQPLLLGLMYLVSRF